VEYEKRGSLDGPANHAVGVGVVHQFPQLGEKRGHVGRGGSRKDNLHHGDLNFPAKNSLFRSTFDAAGIEEKRPERTMLGMLTMGTKI
jgi:hypothetical protein